MLIHLVNDGRFSWIFMILVARVCMYTDDGGLLAWDALRCHVVFSDRRFDHFSPHYYYLKGLLFCFWLILQPPGDRNHDVGLGQAWPAWWLRSSCLLLVLPNQIFYTTHQWLPLASDNKFHSKWSKMLLLDSSRKINHLCNLFNDLTWTQKKFNSQQ